MSSFIDKFTSFATKYGSEVNNIAGILGVLISSLPINKSEKTQIVETIDGLRKVEANISASLKGLKEATVVKISKKDIEDAVKAVLPEIIAAELAKIEDAKAPPEEGSTDHA